MNRDELEGKGEQLKGKIKQGAGDLTGNERLHDEGVADEAARIELGKGLNRGGLEDSRFEQPDLGGR